MIVRSSILLATFLWVGANVQAQTVLTEGSRAASSLQSQDSDQRPLDAQSVRELRSANEAGQVETPAGACRRFDRPPSVNVKLRNGNSFHGTLLCLGDEVQVAVAGRVSRTPLADIVRIAEPRDPVWDGTAVGAAIGAFIWAICNGACDSGYMLRTTFYYSMLGLALDAASSRNTTIYRSSLRSPGVAFRFRF